MSDQDRPAVEAVQRGDREAYRTLVERHQGRVIAVLQRMVRDPHQAEELAQEAFVRAYHALPGFRGDARFGTWIVQIALHAARDHLRRARRAPVVPIEALEASRLAASSGPDPFRALEDRERMERLDAALEDLPPAYREVFVLKHVEGMSFEEIAAVVGDSVGTLKVRAHRARRLLRESLERAGIAEDELRRG